ncbi:MAG: hypothetical protein QM736_26045 [Vicinamibacterales bacterium]
MKRVSLRAEREAAGAVRELSAHMRCPKSDAAGFKHDGDAVRLVTRALEAI